MTYYIDWQGLRARYARETVASVCVLGGLGHTSLAMGLVELTRYFNHLTSCHAGRQMLCGWLMLLLAKSVSDQFIYYETVRLDGDSCFKPHYYVAREAQGMQHVAV